MRKRRSGASAALIGALLTLTVLSGCAASAKKGSESERERLYVGWVRFAGEFALYADPNAFANSSTSHCVSGALPPELQKQAAAEFSGKRVRVRARPVPWSELPADALTLNNQGSPITNWCGDRVVLFASEMKLDERPPFPSSATH
jgi:hypothetical protein